jgi:hypothetical protein
MTSRPKFDMLTGALIQYADSPTHDQNGARIVYGVEKTNPAQWDQSTGLMISMTVSVSGGGEGSSAPSAGTATVTRTATTSIGDPPGVLNVEAGTSVGAARNLYASEYGLESGLLANVNGREVTDGATLNAGDALTFRNAMKARG